jgi:PleD family two-component response regulator
MLWKQCGNQLRAERTREMTKLIAIIDDDDAMRDSLCDLMEAGGLVARCFGSAEEFLESGLHCQAACLITDILMPKMSGLELQTRLKDEECDIPIIFNYCLWRCRDADSGDERGRSRVPCETLRSSLVAQNGPSCT